MTSYGRPKGQTTVTSVQDDSLSASVQRKYLILV